MDIENTKRINQAIAATTPYWQAQTTFFGKESPTHDAISAIALLIGEEPFEYITAKVKNTAQRAEIEFEVVLFTAKRIVHVVHNPGDERPLVSVRRRGNLHTITVKSAPIATHPNLESSWSPLNIEVGYPGRLITLPLSNDYDYEASADLSGFLPSLLEELDNGE